MSKMIVSLYREIVLELVLKFEKDCVKVFKNWIPLDPKLTDLSIYAIQVATKLNEYVIFHNLL